MTKQRLEDKVAIITGGGGGIASAAGKIFARKAPRSRSSTRPLKLLKSPLRASVKVSPELKYCP